MEGKRARLALLSLWAVPTLGPKSLAKLEREFPGAPEVLLDVPPSEWVHRLELAIPVRERLRGVQRLGAIGERVLERARQARMEIAFADEPAYPDRLREIEDAPPLLFYWGTPGPSRRRIAMVGCRHPDTGFEVFVRGLAGDVAAGGVGVVSGGAVGVDQAAHIGALQAGGETLAFVGSALDELDSAQRGLVGPFLDGAGVLYSELPPRVRASKTTFPLRNRLISGASDATLVMRATEKSGSLHTAIAAQRQGRPILAVPGSLDLPEAVGCNRLLSEGGARACYKADHVFRAVGQDSATKPAPERQAANLKELSPDAQRAFEVLGRAPRSFEQIRAATSIVSGSLTSALCELELVGLVVQRPGKRYERI